MPACGRFSASTRRARLEHRLRPRPCCRRRGSSWRAFRTMPSSTTGSIASSAGRCRGGRRGRAARPRRWARAPRRGCPSSSRRAGRRRPRRAAARSRGGSSGPDRRPHAPPPTGSGSRRARGRDPAPPTRPRMVRGRSRLSLVRSSPQWPSPRTSTTRASPRARTTRSARWTRRTIEGGQPRVEF